MWAFFYLLACNIMDHVERYELILFTKVETDLEFLNDMVMNYFRIIIIIGASRVIQIAFISQVKWFGLFLVARFRLCSKKKCREKLHAS